MSGGLLALRGVTCSGAGRPVGLLVTRSSCPPNVTLRLLSYGRQQHKVGRYMRWEMKLFPAKLSRKVLFSL